MNARSTIRKKTLFSCLFLCVILLMCFSLRISAEENDSPAKILNGKTAGVMTGTPQDEMVKANVEDPELLYFDTMADIALALNNGKIDYFVNSSIAFRILEETYPQFGYINVPFRSLDIGAIFPKNEKGEALCSEFNEFLKQIQADGTLDQLKEYWLFPKEWDNIDIPSSGENGTLHMALSSTMKPFAFVQNGQYVGFDVAVAAAFCQAKGYALEIEDTLFAGVLSGVATGKYDLAAGQISYTEERGKSVLFSDFYCQQDIVPIVLESAFPDAVIEKGQSSTQTGLDLWGSIQRTLIDENRWQLILSGLGITLVITLFGFLLANLLGALFCSMAMSSNRLLRILADLYSKIMQGTPMVVILLILYYIVFGSTKISGVIVAILGFGITSGAYLAQIFQGGIQSVDEGQKEAALAIGFTRTQAFTGIILPQAIRSMLPGYFSQLISLMKGTAVVGYIAVADLTKSGDIIRSSTFEPFVPLIVVALIYFGIACLLLSILKQIQRKLAPKRVSGGNNPAVIKNTQSGKEEKQ